MTPQAKVVWDALEFRKPVLLKVVEPLSREELLWVPAPAPNCIAWQLWHLAEAEDNWYRNVVLGEAKRYPFGVSVHAAGLAGYPDKTELLDYLHDVRALTKARLEAASDGDFDRTVHDAHFGVLTVREVWGGIVTSFAWHAGQAMLTSRLLSHFPHARFHNSGISPL